MESEREPETPVRMFRRWHSVRVELVDVTETTRGWDGFLFRGVTIGNVRHPRGEACYCTKKKWTELTPESGG